MQEPELYNVLHIGPEQSSPLDQKIVREARRSRFSVMVGAALLSVFVLCIFSFALSFANEVHHNDDQIEALIDEVGSLSQANFNLQEQVSSQHTVLRNLEQHFTDLGQALQTGSKTDIAALFTSILEQFAQNNQGGTLVDDVVLASEEDSTFDVLILGTNGSLTDTIMLASVNVDEEKISLLSVPRDLYVNGRRINEYYNLYGVDTLKRMVESVTGLHVDNYVKVDLQGFVTLVDLVGGLEIDVDKAIYDGSYPNGKGGYDPYSIEVGYYHMSGEEALRYARSRKSTTDFDRAARQQKVIAALRVQLLTLDDGMEMKDLTALFQTGLSNTVTDMNLLDILGYYYDYRDFNVYTGFVLTSTNYLYSMINEGGAYILLPKTGNYDEIHQVISELVN